MLYHQLSLIFRHFKRHKSTFFINLFGLSLGLACVLLIYLWVSDEWQTDKFHEKRAQLYQVMANHEDSEGIRTLHETPDLLAETLAAEMPEVEMATSYLPADMIPVKFVLTGLNNTKIKAVGQFADKQFFEVFSYPLLLGNAAQVMQEPNAVILSEKTARALFQSPEKAMGQGLPWQLASFDRQSVVRGVFKDLPANSSNQFDFVLTAQTFRDPTLFNRGIHWGNHGPSTFLVLKKGTDVAAFEQKIAGFIKSKLASSQVTLFLQPYAERYLHDQYEAGIQIGGRITYVRLLSLIALFILLIACINFMNLSTAQASLRTKEIGIKKAIGISRAGLARQFLTESLILSISALVVATGLVYLLLPQFNALTGKTIQLNTHMDWVLPFICIALLTGLVAGSYPALYLSGFQPIAMLKGKMSRNKGEAWTRKSLVVAQFSLSIVFILAVTVIYRQIQLVQTKNMGFQREQVIRFTTEGKVGQNLDAFISGLKEQAGVMEVAGISGTFLGDNAHTVGLNWPGKTEAQTITFSHFNGTHRLIETLGLQMAEGRAFSPDFPSDSTGVIFNETAVKAMGLDNPLGKIVQIWDQNHQIVGVVKDFHMKSLRENIEPGFIRVSDRRITEMMVKMQAGKERETLQNIERFYSQFNPGYTFECHFLDEDFQKMYVSEHRMSVLSKYFAGLAILLSCLGLFGLAAFTAEQRSKEIGIRKVLGASVAGITGLLATEFIKLVLVAFVIASPIAYYFMQKWLANFAYHIEIQAWMFVLAGLAACLVAGLTVSYQSIKAALINPIQSLKSE